MGFSSLDCWGCIGETKTLPRNNVFYAVRREREFHIYIPLQANRCAKTRCQKAVGGVKKCS